MLCDLLIFGSRQVTQQQNSDELEADVILRIHQAFAYAVRNSCIPMERLDTSVKRNLCFKQQNLQLAGHVCEVKMSTEEVFFTGGKP